FSPTFHAKTLEREWEERRRFVPRGTPLGERIFPLRMVPLAALAVHGLLQPSESCRKFRGAEVPGMFHVEHTNASLSSFVTLKPSSLGSTIFLDNIVSRGTIPH